jgi:hypothetical protein
MLNISEAPITRETHRHFRASPFRVTLPSQQSAMVKIVRPVYLEDLCFRKLPCRHRRFSNGPQRYFESARDQQRLEAGSGHGRDLRAAKGWREDTGFRRSKQLSPCPPNQPL